MKKIPRLKNSRGKIKSIIYKALMEKLPDQRACDLAGIDINTFKRWMDKGKDSKNTSYHIFRKKVLQIKAKHESDMLDVISGCAQGGQKSKRMSVAVDTLGKREVVREVKTSLPDWKAAAWFLQVYRKSDYNPQYEKPDDTTPKEEALEIANALEEMFKTVPIE